MINGLFTLVIFIFCALSALGGKYTTIILDAGHGGKDRGAKWGGISEAYLNLTLTKRVESLLKANRIPVRLTRTSDVYLSLAQRAAVANRYRDAIFLSIHFNAHTNTSFTGVETFYISEKGKRIATNIQSGVIRQTKARNRGIKFGKEFAVLNKTNGPAVLVECGFMSNPYERRRCSEAWYQALLARGIVDGIIKSR